MEWITSKVTDIKSVLASIFTAIVVAMAIKAFVERKMINVFLLIILAGLLGWFVYDPEGAINVFKGFWNSGATKKVPK